MADFFLALGAYLIGAIPFAYLFGRLFKRVDIIIYVLAIMIVIAVIIRDTNTAAGLGILSLPLFLGLHGGQWEFFFAALAISLLVISRHLNDFRAYRQGRRKLV